MERWLNWLIWLEEGHLDFSADLKLFIDFLHEIENMNFWFLYLMINKQRKKEIREAFYNYKARDNFVIIFALATKEIESIFFQFLFWEAFVFVFLFFLPFPFFLFFTLNWFLLVFILLKSFSKMYTPKKWIGVTHQLKDNLFYRINPEKLTKYIKAQMTGIKMFVWPFLLSCTFSIAHNLQGNKSKE